MLALDRPTVSPSTALSAACRGRRLLALDRPLVRGATYFSNPASNTSRSHLTIRKSTDNAATWGKSLLVQTDASEGYSCLVKGAIMEGGKATTDGGLLYEAADGTIKFVRFPLSLSASE